MQASFFDTLPRQMTVKEITAYIRQRLERDATLQNVWLSGEVSNWKPAASGHLYFTLKDRDASIRCVMWRTQARRLRYRPDFDGEAVLAHGKVSVYEIGGSYQFYVDELQAAGQGDLQAEFERIKHRLAEEGLFDDTRKQPLPAYPQTIGIVTSSEAAALQDILNVLRRRYPLAQVILAPTLVQGQEAPRRIVSALQAIQQEPVDLIILTRGGGSLEDLWAFNDETVARTIADCPIPIVTGIGHEVDFTIADFVADLRAPTPSAAAELATPDVLDLQRQLAEQQRSLSEAVQRQLADKRADLHRQQWLLERLSPTNLISNHRQRLDEVTQQLQRAARLQVSTQRNRLETLTAQLQALNPEAVLARGYAIVQKGETLITQASQIAVDDALTVKFVDGEVEVKVSAVSK